MNTRIVLSLFSLLIFFLNSFSQVVNENINFDNYVSTSDNDLVNHFYGMQSLTNIPGSGITGGSLLPIDSNNWGNDNSGYCSKFKAVHGSPYKTSICFYYDPSLISATGFDRAVSIWLNPHADFNHYIIATVSHGAKIEMLTYYNSAYSVVPMPLQSGHWYNLQLGFNLPFTPNPYYISFYAKVDDLGTSGTSAPVNIDSVASSIIDTILASDSAIEVSITGARYGGSAYLDNFSFSGVKSADSCLFTAIHDNADMPAEIKINAENNQLTIEGNDIANKSFELYDINGNKIMSSRLVTDKNQFETAFLSDGIYFLSVFDLKQRLSYKIFVHK